MGCTHPRLVSDLLMGPLDGALVGWLTSLVGAQRRPLEHLYQHAEDEDEDVDSWVHQHHIQVESYLNSTCYCCSMNLPTYVSAKIVVSYWDQYRSKMPHDQRTFLEDPYGYAVKGLSYGIIAGRVLMACENVVRGAAIMSWILQVKFCRQPQYCRSSHCVLLIQVPILRRRCVINNGIPM